MDTAEPRTPDQVAHWVAAQARETDHFRAVYDASEEHRLRHGTSCDVYPSSIGPLLGTLVAAAGAKRILELGCGLGYSALWLAYGAGPDGRVDTCELDPAHADLARGHVARYSDPARVTVHVMRAGEFLREARDPYDFVFCDAHPEEYPAFLDDFVRLLPPGGTLVTSNLFLGVHLPDAPWLARAARYRDAIASHESLSTAFLVSGHALSVRR